MISDVKNRKYRVLNIDFRNLLFRTSLYFNNVTFSKILALYFCGPPSTSWSLCIYSLLLNFVGSVVQPETTGLSSERREELAGGSDGNAGEKYVLSLSVNF